MCDLSPDTQCLICYFQYATIRFVKFVKGQELEITFCVFSVYLGVEAITFWGAFQKGSVASHQYVQNGMFHLLSCPGMSTDYGSDLGSLCSGREDTVSCPAAVN